MYWIRSSRTSERVDSGKRAARVGFRDYQGLVEDHAPAILVQKRPAKRRSPGATRARRASPIGACRSPIASRRRRLPSVGARCGSRSRRRPIRAPPSRRPGCTLRGYHSVPSPGWHLRTCSGGGKRPVDTYAGPAAAPLSGRVHRLLLPRISPTPMGIGGKLSYRQTLRQYDRPPARGYNP